MKLPRSRRRAEQVRSIITRDAERYAVLKLVSSLKLPNCWVGAGFVRNAVWDYRHGYRESTPLNDIDVAYFDPSSDASRDQRLESWLGSAGVTPASFSVKNQHRMHARNYDEPYSGTLDAISHWTETCTCVAARLIDGEVDVFAAYGWDDAFELLVRPRVDTTEARALVLNRASAKRWAEIWPRLRILA